MLTRNSEIASILVVSAKYVSTHPLVSFICRVTSKQLTGTIPLDRSDDAKGLGLHFKIERTGNRPLTPSGHTPPINILTPQSRASYYAITLVDSDCPLSWRGHDARGKQFHTGRRSGAAPEV